MARVFYNGNGNTGGSAPVDNNVYNNGDTVTVLGNTSHLANGSDTFFNWTTNANGTGTGRHVGGTFVIAAADVTLYAQWLTNAELTGDGITAHYQFSYNIVLATSGIEPARTNAVISACESDFSIMSNWFGGIDISPAVTIPMPVAVTALGGGAGTGGHWPAIGCSLKPGRENSDYCRTLLVAEVTELLMAAQGQGWYAPDKSNEQSSGEGLSHFLNQQFQITIGHIPGLAFNATRWLNSSLPPSNSSSTRIGRPTANYDYQPRYDYINNILEHDNSNSPASGCSVMFLWYLFTQLGFSVSQICQAAAPTIAEVYRILTGDTGDPFPFFKLLMDNAYPVDAVALIPPPNHDNPFPLALLSFWVDKSTFGIDEVTDIINSSRGRVENAFWLILEGFNINTYLSLGVTISEFTGSFKTNIPGIQIVPNAASAVEYENPSNLLLPQRVRLAFDIVFVNDTTANSLTAFPATRGARVQLELDTSVTIGGKVILGSGASTIFELVAGANPYFTNINPILGNVPWLSQDLRVFTVTPGQNNAPIGNTAVVPRLSPANNSILDAAAGFQYMQNLIGYLNGNFSRPAGTDPFSLFPGQAGESTADSSVTPLTVDLSNPLLPKIYTNYNFAIARVRLRGTAVPANVAQHVKVFFRLWSTQTADTDFNTATYPSVPDALGLPDSPSVAPDNHTIPFFATGNYGANTDYIAGGVNNQLVQIITGDSVWAYFGCFLNVYDPANIVNDQYIQNLLPGTHHCLVAQIACDDAPIVNANGIAMGPENSDKLAQRNLQVTVSDNPGPPASHRIPQTFDLRPSKPLANVSGSLLNYPDELMIDWGGIPVNGDASIYWPGANIADVIGLANNLYAAHTLSSSDTHTLHCKTTKGVTYVPIPVGTGQNLAGLFTVDLPTAVVAGQEFDIIVRRITTRRLGGVDHYVNRASGAVAPIGNSETDDGSNPAETLVPSNNTQKNWRYVTGTFQVKIPVRNKATMLLPEENTLAIMKARLQAMSPANRWYPVLQRYILYLSARIDGLGGDSAAIKPSYQGALPQKPGKEIDVYSNNDKCCKTVILLLAAFIFVLLILILILLLRK
ncbi:MAG TPA: hypothetical protein VFE53_02360 [Mucilaginibacter sp.]|jgi:hypothetical protein|nr:hypothetical protein [Mucilaginibacter sp.]